MTAAEHRIAAVTLCIYIASLKPAAASTRKEGEGGRAAAVVPAPRRSHATKERGEGGESVRACSALYAYSASLRPAADSNRKEGGQERASQA